MELQIKDVDLERFSQYLIEYEDLEAFCKSIVSTDNKEASICLTIAKSDLFKNFLNDFMKNDGIKNHIYSKYNSDAEIAYSFEDNYFVYTENTYDNDFDNEDMDEDDFDILLNPESGKKKRDRHDNDKNVIFALKKLTENEMNFINNIGKSCTKEGFNDQLAKFDCNQIQTVISLLSSLRL